MTPLLQHKGNRLYLRLMKVPASFRVGLPGPFVKILATSGTRSAAEVSGQWVEMRGGPLPARIAVRVDQADDGRFILTGLMIGMRDRREITWETLRSIKPSTLLGYLFAGFDPARPAEHVDSTKPTVSVREFLESEDDAAGIKPDDELWLAHARAAAAYEIWKTTLTPEDGRSPVETVTKPRASVATDLRRFADVYQRHAATTPRRATQATADELFISRATVIRRVAECRQLGLIPAKGATP